MNQSNQSVLKHSNTDSQEQQGSFEKALAHQHLVFVAKKDKNCSDTTCNAEAEIQARFSFSHGYIQ